MNIKLVISYDGTRYLGWQKTKTGPSIEEELERALAQILQETAVLQAASRTDRGVHAEGQVVNFLTAKEHLDMGLLQKGLNAVLPKDITVKSAEQVHDAFHPTLDCKAKEYHYYLCNVPVQLPFHRHFSWHVHRALALEEMRKAAESLLGKHDFSAFCNERTEWTRSDICEISELKIEELDFGRIRISIVGDHFLYKMVRNLVGTLVYIGMGKLSCQAAAQILESRNRTQGGMTAPAHGLTLKQVLYN